MPIAIRLTISVLDELLRCTYKQLDFNNSNNQTQRVGIPVKKIIKKAGITSPEYSSQKPNPIDIHVGSRVRMQRVLAGMSQQKLGDELDLTFQQVQKYEKGTNRIGASRLWELGRIFAVPVQFFYDDLVVSSADRSMPGFSEPTTETNYTEFLNTREGIDLNRAFQKITDPKVRRNIVELVQSMADKQSD